MNNTEVTQVQVNSNPGPQNLAGNRGMENTGYSYPIAAPRNDLAKLYRLWGEQAVLIACHRGTKKPIGDGWQKRTLEESLTSEYQQILAASNIGVLVGEKSGNLVDIDCDTDGFMDAFTEANRDLCAKTFSTKGERGCHYWFRLVGEYPKLVGKIKDNSGGKAGDYRGGSGCTLIAGTHPCGLPYRILNEQQILEISFGEINWPEGYSYSWMRAAKKAVGVGAWSVPSMPGDSESGGCPGGGYDKPVLEALKLRLPDYLRSNGVDLIPSGEGFVALCPCHKDRNPSFSVFGDDNQLWKCHSCGDAGDVFQLSQWLGRSNTFPEAVRDVAGVLGVTLSDVRVPTLSGPCEIPEFDVLAPEEQETRDVPFPVHCFPGVAGEMAREIARVTTSQNLPLAAASVLGVLSASLGAGLEINTGGERRTRGNLYILAIADSGTGKGEAFDLAAAPLQDFESLVTGDFEMAEEPRLNAELQVTESRAKELGKRVSREDDPVKIARLMKDQQSAAIKIKEIQQKLGAKPQLIVADATKEALAIRLAGQAGEALASMSSEARGVFSIIKGRYGKEGGDEDFYCKCYSGDSISVDRVGRPRVGLRRPCLSILWMVQPDAARDAFSNVAFTESGLMPRFLVFNARAEPLVRDRYPDPIPSEIKGGWAKLVSALTAGYRMTGLTPRTVAVAGGVAGVMLDYENENIRMRQRSGEMSDIASYVARWTENAWRMALVLHAAKHGAEAHTKELDEDTATKAVEISRWFGMMQSEVLNAGRIKKMRDRLVRVQEILDDRKGEISLRELRRSHSIEKEEIVSLGKWFPGKFKIVTRDTGGRPSEVLTNRPEDLKDTETHR